MLIWTGSFLRYRQTADLNKYIYNNNVKNVNNSKLCHVPVVQSQHDKITCTKHRYLHPLFIAFQQFENTPKKTSRKTAYDFFLKGKNNSNFFTNFGQVGLPTTQNRRCLRFF